MEEKEYYFNKKGMISIDNLSKMIEYSKNRICKIYSKNGRFRTGFFCIITLNKSENIRMLMTSSQILEENDLKDEYIIRFTLNNDKKTTCIKRDKSRKIYINDEYDVTFIEIKEIDGIKDISFFEIDYQIFDNQIEYLKHDIYLLFYSGRRGMTFSQGLVERIDESRNEIIHSCDSDAGSLGGPLISFSNNKIIGMHLGQLKKERYSRGILLKDPIKEFTNDVNNIQIVGQLKKERYNKRILLKDSIKEFTNDVNDIQIVRLEKPDFSTKSILKEAIDYGEIIKREIIFDKKNKKKGLINENDILKSNYLYKNMEDIATDNPTEEEQLFVLCLLSKIIKDKGIETAIYKDKNNIICDDSIINMLCCEFLYKYDFIFDFGEEQNKKILNGKIEYENLCKSMKKILSKKLNIDENKIVFSIPKKGSTKISVAFITPGIYQEEELISKLKNVEELEELKNIHKTVLMEGCKLTNNIFNQKGNNKDPGWGEGETRGGENYIPPLGWYGYGLNVENKFDNGNNDWLGYENNENEYAIAYYPIRSYHEDPEEMKKLINSISNLNIIDNKSDSFYNIFEREENINTGNLEQEKCGKGIYFYQDINIAEKQASIIDINGIRYKILIMCRVNPNKIRIPESCPFIWILNPDTSEIRQYRILIKIEALRPIADNTFKVETKPNKYYRDIIKKKDKSFFESLILKNEMEKNNLNKYEAIAKIYTGDDYKFFNNYLLFGAIPDENESGYSEENIKSFIWCLHSTLINYYEDVHSDKLETIKDGKIVYRKTDITFDFEKYGIGSQFYLSNFISTSTNKNSTFTERNRMDITIRNNEKNNYCYYVEKLTENKGEDEVIISPYTSFIITNVTHNEDGSKIVHLECIGYVLDDNKIEEWPPKKNDNLIKK